MLYFKDILRPFRLAHGIIHSCPRQKGAFDTYADDKVIGALLVLIKGPEFNLL